MSVVDGRTISESFENFQFSMILVIFQKISSVATEMTDMNPSNLTEQSWSIGPISELPES